MADVGSQTQLQEDVVTKRAYTREVQHGTVNGYLYRGCRCDECKEARRLYYGQRPREQYLADVEPEHGTESRYSRCRCEKCRAAASAQRATRRRNPHVSKHGPNGYKNGCRCDVCRSGIRVFRRAERAEARERRTA